MDYFVSIENTPYYRWQVELLIQSFKNLGLEDNLLVALAENNTPQYAGYTKNLVKHPRTFSHNNHGTDVGCKEINKPYAILAALSNNLLHEPFTVLHPDMVLYRPVEEKGTNNIYFTAANENPEVKKRLQPYIEKVLVERGDVSNLQWIGVNGPLIFNHVSMLFFARVMHYMEKFSKEYPDWDGVAEAGWLMAMYEHYNLLLFHGKYYECNLVNDLENYSDAFVVHYTEGVPPHFSKKHFMYSDPLQFTFNSNDPMDVLVQYDMSSAMRFTASVIQSYRTGTPSATATPEPSKEPEYALPGPKPPPVPLPDKDTKVMRIKPPGELIEPRIK